MKEDKYVEPRTVLKLHYSDITAEAYACGAALTRDQMMSIFGRVDASRDCAVMEAFWAMVRREIGRETGSDVETGYHDMPEDEPVIAAMWRDVVRVAKDIGVKMSREQVIEAAHGLCDVYSDAIWNTIEDVTRDTENKEAQ